MCKITKENDSLQRQTENKDENSQYLLKDVLNKIIDFRGKTPLKLGMKWGGNIPALSAMNVKDGIIKFNEDTHYGSIELYEKWMTKGDCTKGDIVLTMEAPMGNVAQIPNNQKYILSQRVILLKFNEKLVSNEYMYQYLRSPYFKKQMNRYATGTTAKGIKQKNLIKIRLKIPSLLEQKFIGTFLSAIDKKIGFMEKEINKQSKYMKKIREIILNDNSDNSNKVQLKEICIINKGKQLNKTNMINDGKYYVLNGGKTPSGFTNSWNVPENTISISEGGNSCGFVNYNVQKFYCGGHCYYLTNISDEIDPLLLYHCLKMNENKIMNLRVGSGLPNIQKKDLEKYKLYIPTKNHEKITYLLNNINLKIDLNKEKLNHLKQFKKGLLQKMFC